MKITSTSNDRIKFFKTLKSKKGRQETGTYLIEGKRAVLDAISHGVEFKCILIEENYELEKDVSCEVITVTRHIIEALSDTSSPEGIIAQAYIPDMSFSVEKVKGLCVFLDRLQDAGNVGTIIRTADALGASAVVLSPDCVEVFNPKTVRATMGSVFNLPVMIADDSIKALGEMQANGYTVYSAALKGEDFNSVKNIKSEKSCIVIGNEGNGICDEVLNASDKVITLKMQGNAESLNAAIAAGILIYGFINHD